MDFDGQNAPTAWGVNGDLYLECCSGGLTVNNNRMLGIVGVNNWLWTKGRHSINFGFQVRQTSAGRDQLQLLQRYLQLQPEDHVDPGFERSEFRLCTAVPLPAFFSGRRTPRSAILLAKRSSAIRRSAFTFRTTSRSRSRLTINAGLAA